MVRAIRTSVCSVFVRTTRLAMSIRTLTRPHQLVASARPERGHNDAMVYPRACGGTDTSAARAKAIRGLSPRVRGNRQSNLVQRSITRSIPARAGEPKLPCSRRMPPRVYPRACGGTFAYEDDRDELRGLSPRVRGNRMAETTFIDLLRSIPARAGEPHPIHIFRYPIKVYPRACGGTMYRA